MTGSISIGATACSELMRRILTVLGRGGGDSERLRLRLKESSRRGIATSQDMMREEEEEGRGCSIKLILLSKNRG